MAGIFYIVCWFVRTSWTGVYFISIVLFVCEDWQVGLVAVIFVFVCLFGYTKCADILSSYFCLFVGIGIFVIDCLFVRIY